MSTANAYALRRPTTPAIKLQCTGHQSTTSAIVGQPAGLPHPRRSQTQQQQEPHCCVCAESLLHYRLPCVQEICRDIRKLDHAKANLTATITAFRRLSMLVTAVGESGFRLSSLFWL